MNEQQAWYQGWPVIKGMYKNPKLSLQNQVSFTCSDTAVESVLKILQHLRTLGNHGASREVVIDKQTYYFDGDGSDKLDYIKVNGLSLEEWDKEGAP